MFILDNILLFPVRGIMAAFREIYNVVEQESANEAETIRRRLSELYMMLETQRITEAEFDSEEKELLDRLDAIEAAAVEAQSQAELDEIDVDDSEDEIDVDDSEDDDDSIIDAQEPDEDEEDEEEEEAVHELEEELV